LNEQPGLDFVQRWYFNAYFELRNSGLVGFNGPQPLQVSEINAYMDMKGIDGTGKRSRFLEYMQSLDRVYLDDQYEDDE
jgi:hypothetical protein